MPTLFKDFRLSPMMRIISNRRFLS